MTKSRHIRRSYQFWTAADNALMRRDYPHQPTTTIARRVRRSVPATYNRAATLGLRKSAAYLASPAACRLRRGDHVGAASRYLKGHVPANKGLRRPGYSPGRMRETQFKKGQRSGVAVRLYKPIGTERISKDGYLQRKVNDDLPLQRRWRAVHIIVWEAAHGPLPPSHAVTFVNGDKSDIRLDNLACISRLELMLRNSVHALPPALASAVMVMAALTRQIKRRTSAEQH